MVTKVLYSSPLNEEPFEDNAPNLDAAVLSPDQEASEVIAGIKVDLQGRMDDHAREAKRLRHLADQHENAASKYRIMITAGDPVAQNAKSHP